MQSTDQEPLHQSPDMTSPKSRTECEAGEVCPIFETLSLARTFYQLLQSFNSDTSLIVLKTVHTLSIASFFVFKYCATLKCSRCHQGVKGVWTIQHFQISLLNLQPPLPHLILLWRSQQPGTLGTLLVQFRQHFQIFLRLKT